MTKSDVRAVPRAFLAALVVFVATACETNIAEPELGARSRFARSANQSAWAAKKKRPVPVDPQPTATWYVEVVDIDPDPLHRFRIEGDEVLLRTDPTVTSWGEDYWGYWSDPYTMVDNEVEYTIGLTHTTYTFDPVSGGGFDVTKRLIVSSYNGGPPDTTFTHPGVYDPE